VMPQGGKSCAASRSSNMRNHRHCGVGVRRVSDHRHIPPSRFRCRMVRLV
jgi:hypothetical protein